MINNIGDINGKTEEGKLLIAAIGRLMCIEKYTNKTPEDIIELLNEITKDFD